VRLLLLIAVIALFVDALFYSGNYTQSAFKQVTVAAEHVVDAIEEAVEVKPEAEAES